MDGGEDYVRDAGRFRDEGEDGDWVTGGVMVRLVVAYYARNGGRGWYEGRHGEGVCRGGKRYRSWMGIGGG